MKFQTAIISSAIAIAVPLIPFEASKAAETENAQQLRWQANSQQFLQQKLPPEPDRSIEGRVRIIRGRNRLGPVPFTARVFEQDNGDLIVELDYAARIFQARVEPLRPDSMTFARGTGRFSNLVGYYLPSKNTLQFWGPVEEQDGQTFRVVRNFRLDDPLF